jgi:DNA-binding transcriptional ArsR family regulator
MAWRIHFSAADLARTTVSAGLGPLAETLAALVLLRSDCGRLARFRGWREQIGRQAAPRMQPLAALFPPESLGVDLWTLTGHAPTIEQGVAALLRAPREHMLTEIEGVDRQYRLPRSAWAVAEPGGEGRLRLAAGLEGIYRALVEPYWPRMQTCLRAEQAYRNQVMADGGVGGLLTTLRSPKARWHMPVLEIASGGDGDMYLDGRGVTLVPSMFVADIPILLTNSYDHSAPRMLLFSAMGGTAAAARLWATEPREGGALAALLGRTRAAVLTSIADGSSTTDIALRAGISLAGASQHTTVLRDAGLITTHRRGCGVRHTLTPLGAGLLAADGFAGGIG